MPVQLADYVFRSAAETLNTCPDYLQNPGLISTMSTMSYIYIYLKTLITTCPLQSCRCLLFHFTYIGCQGCGPALDQHVAAATRGFMRHSALNSGALPDRTAVLFGLGEAAGGDAQAGGRRQAGGVPPTLEQRRDHGHQQALHRLGAQQQRLQGEVLRPAGHLLLERLLGGRSLRLQRLLLLVCAAQVRPSVDQRTTRIAPGRPLLGG